MPRAVLRYCESATTPGQVWAYQCGRTGFPFSCILPNMTFCLDTLSSLFGRVFGDPCNRTQCASVSCSRDVAKGSRVHAAILLKLNNQKTLDSVDQLCVTVTKYMLCDDCKLDPHLVQESSQTFNNSLRDHAGRLRPTDSDISDHNNPTAMSEHWPTSLCWAATATA